MMFTTRASVEAKHIYRNTRKEDEKNSAGKREDFHYIFYEFRFSGELVGSKEGF